MKEIPFMDMASEGLDNFRNVREIEKERFVTYVSYL